MGDLFGAAVAISGDTVVVGAPGENSSATGVNGNENDNSATSSGAAYVFVRSGSVWSQQAYLKASNTDAVDGFGVSVAISGDTIVVGSGFEASLAAGVNGDESDNSGGAGGPATGPGAAYVFVRSGSAWSQQAYLKSSSPLIFGILGISVGISGDTIVVGTGHETALVFFRSGSTWSQQASLLASNAESDFFGQSVAVSGDTAVIGAPFESSSATGVNGNEADNGAFRAGAAYVFVRSGTIWSQQAYLKASNTDAQDQFGGWRPTGAQFAYQPVAISDGTLVVGAPGESSNATGVNGNESDNSASGSGAAYVFDPSANQTLPAQLMTDPPLVDSGGDPGTGPSINDPSELFDLLLDCSGMSSSGIYVIVLRLGHLSAPASSGFGHVWIAGQKLTKRSGAHNQNTVSWGSLVLPNDPNLVGLDFTAQAFCSQGGGGSRVSNGLVQTIGP